MQVRRLDGKEAGAMKVKAYHSAHPSDPQVYHDDDECAAGREIPWWNKQMGTDQRPRCEYCISIDAHRPVALSGR